MSTKEKSSPSRRGFRLHGMAAIGYRVLCARFCNDIDVQSDTVVAIQTRYKINLSSHVRCRVALNLDFLCAESFDGADQQFFTMMTVVSPWSFLFSCLGVLQCESDYKSPASYSRELSQPPCKADREFR